MNFIEYVQVLTHRVLAGHRPHEVCDECPWVWCIHCDDFGPRGDDHTCPCPYSDDECPTHTAGPEDGPLLCNCGHDNRQHRNDGRATSDWTPCIDRGCDCEAFDPMSGDTGTKNGDNTNE